MDPNEIGALKELLAKAEEYENRPKYEIIKTFFSKDISATIKNQLLVVKWMSGQVGLECRKMYLHKKKQTWVLGGRSRIELEELDFIQKNYTEIRAVLSSQKSS